MEDEFQVLATDYESFSLEYKCDPNGLLEKSGRCHFCGTNLNTFLFYVLLNDMVRNSKISG